MKRRSVVGAILSSFLLGAAMTAVAQEEEHKQQEEHKQEATPPAKQEPATPEERKNQQTQKDERQQPAQQDERQMKQQPEQQKKMEKQQEKMETQQGREQERQRQAQPQQPMQGGQQQGRPQRGQNQRHISDHDFHAHFGREHRFAPGHMQVYEGRPKFSYSGYVFELVDVWPTDWAYDTDDYYIDYFDDEYWLCSFSHSDIRLELIIVG